MGTTPSDTWFDSEGKAVFWKNIPLKTVKKALFSKGDTVRQLAKMVLNGIAYDFNKTAEGGAVIVPPDYAAIEFISPDGRIDYAALLKGNLGNAMSETITALKRNPVPAWDKFAKWMGGNGPLGDVSDIIPNCNLQTISGGSSVSVSVPVFGGVTDMASFLEAVYTATAAAHGNALSLYQLDDASFGWRIQVPLDEGEIAIGFIFRE